MPDTVINSSNGLFHSILETTFTTADEATKEQ